MVKHPTVAMSRPQSAEITYVYTKTGQVDSMFYPAISVAVDYRYSPRKWLDTLKATKGGVDLFKEELTFDAAGRITRQNAQHGTSPALRQDYGYDGINQLTTWLKKPTGQPQTNEAYSYDAVGNRTSLTYSGTGMSPPFPQEVSTIGRTVGGPGIGPNQLLKTQGWIGSTAGEYTEYTYDRNGSMTSRKDYTSTNVLTKEERFGYSSWRNLPWSYEREDPTITVGPNVWEYRYRYNAQGEREQKREWLTPAGDVTAPGYEWTYYLLGGSKEQMSVWKGMQTSESGFCGDTGTGSNVYLYPVEYLTYGGPTVNLTNRTSGSVEYRITDHIGSNRVVLDNTGTVLLTTDYAPFGKSIAGGEDRKSWIDKEIDKESGLGNFGVRAYEFERGRFSTIDYYWESYPLLSPYSYAGNNPIKYIDPTGKYIDLFKVFFRYDFESSQYVERVGRSREVAEQFIEELRQISGLDLGYDEESRRLIVKTDKISGGSETARSILSALIKNESDRVPVIMGTAMTSGNWFGKNTVYLNPLQIRDFVSGTDGVNSMTMGFGMIFMHEVVHTDVMGDTKDPVDGRGAIGIPDMVGNQIRLELGSDWGQRESYAPYLIDGIYYFPFSDNAIECLESGIVPDGGYVKFSDDDAKYWTPNVPE